MISSLAALAPNTQPDKTPSDCRGYLNIFITIWVYLPLPPNIVWRCGARSSPWPVQILNGKRVEEQVIESLIGCTDDARFIVRTLQYRLACPTQI